MNALHHHRSRGLVDDTGSPLSLSLQLADIGAGTHVSMVGYFPPLVRALPELGVELDVIDSSLGLGDPLEFRARLGSWTEVLIMTATTLLNESAEELLLATGPGVRSIMMGPSTPLVPAAFAHLPLTVLAGIVTLRHGRRREGRAPRIGDARHEAVRAQGVLRLSARRSRAGAGTPGMRRDRPSSAKE